MDGLLRSRNAVREGSGLNSKKALGPADACVRAGRYCAPASEGRRRCVLRAQTKTTGLTRWLAMFAFVHIPDFEQEVLYLIA